MLRHSYYHKLTTSPWSRILQPDGWTDNVEKWRYWSQLKSYITGNNQDILILRDPQKNTDAIKSEPELPDEIEEVFEPDTPSVINRSSEALPSINESEPEEIDVDPPIANHPKYDSVSIAPWFKEGIDYSQPDPSEMVSLSESIANKSDEAESDEIDETVRETIVETDVPSTTEDSDLVEEVVNTSSEEVINPNETEIETPIIEPARTISRPNSSSYNTSLAPEAFASLKGNLPWPVQGGRITDGFGIRKNAEVRGLSPQNYGIDMLCTAGATIKAAHGGTILLARRQSPYDVIVTIKHGDYTTAYYYLITTYVKQGDVVQAGQAIGQLRTSVEEADFHFEIWYNQERMNPEVWLK